MATPRQRQRAIRELEAAIRELREAINFLQQNRVKAAQFEIGDALRAEGRALNDLNRVGVV